MLRLGRIRFEVGAGDGTGPGESSSQRFTWVAALAVIAAVAGVGLSVASDKAPGKITACVERNGGEARIIKGGKCQRGERKVTWSKIGPVGPAGQTGEAGPPGIVSFNDIAGLPCTRNAQQGTVELTFDTGGVAVPRCRLPGDGPVCGDGLTEGGEACDDGNDDPHDSCTNACQPSSCGDGTVLVGTEQCDTSGASASCDGDCTVAYCGDGTTNAQRGEVCDGSDANTAICDYDCSAPSCGDGVSNAASGEECDDGNMVASDACTNACDAAFCGDGVVRAGFEECDDGNNDDTDACSNACTTNP